MIFALMPATDLCCNPSYRFPAGVPAIMLPFPSNEAGDRRYEGRSTSISKRRVRIFTTRVPPKHSFFSTVDFCVTKCGKWRISTRNIVLEQTSMLVAVFWFNFSNGESTIEVLQPRLVRVMMFVLMPAAGLCCNPSYKFPAGVPTIILRFPSNEVDDRRC